MGRGEPLAFSLMSLLEVALLSEGGRLGLGGSVDEFFEDLGSDESFLMLAVTYEIALEVPYLSPTEGPRRPRLRLVTSDQRLIESGLVPIID